MIDIFIKSYRNDFKLLNYALRSIQTNVTGYRRVVLLIPLGDMVLFNERVIIPSGLSVMIDFVDEYGNGYLFQQWCKISAHNYTDADFILFADSDCIFDKKIDISEYVASGKPDLLYTDYLKVGAAICWKAPTEAFIKTVQDYEFMRRNCLIYHRSTLEAIEKYEPNLEYNIMSSNSFSEFNAIGAFAFQYEKEKYNFINTDSIGIDPTIQNVQPLAIQLWSYADKNNRDKFHQTEYARTRKVIKEVFNEEISW